MKKHGQTSFWYVQNSKSITRIYIIRVYNVLTRGEASLLHAMSLDSRHSVVVVMKKKGSEKAGFIGGNISIGSN
jgi:hypothetical protein